MINKCNGSSYSNYMNDSSPGIILEYKEKFGTAAAITLFLFKQFKNSTGTMEIIQQKPFFCRLENGSLT